MGDIRDCVPTALMNMDAAAFFSKYLQDARDSQLPTGQFCDITPHAQLRGSSICAGSPGWADAGVTMAWDLYMATGDETLLDRHFAAMTRWVDFVHQHNPDLLWLNQLGMNWGDWMSPGSPVTPKVLAATAYFAHSADLTGKAAAILGRRLDAEKYHELYKGICRAFVRRWVKADGTIYGGAQGSYALALQFELLSPDLIAPAMHHLTDAINRNHGHLTTGYLSTRALVQALSRFGGHEVASRMINQVTRLSWGYMVDTIGTTFWESFNAYIKGQVVTLSLCHWAWSSIGEWFWRYVAGIGPVEQRAGWREFHVEPRPTPEVRWCEAEYQSPAGRIDLNWRAKGKELVVQLGVPLNTMAVVKLPVDHNSRLILNGRTMSAETVNKMARPNGSAEGLRLAGGRYTLSLQER
jgi:alpha-L-rhamnosidase